MKLVKESVNPRYERIRNEYVKWADSHTLPENKESVEEWAKKRTCVNQNVSEEQFNEALFESLLTEDTLEQAAEKQLNAEVAYKGTIEKELDKALEYNLEEHETGGRDFKNVLFVGEAGSGKTSRIRQWARDNGINLVVVRGADLDATDFGGALLPDKEGHYASKLGSKEFDNLNEPKSVLFLDEYNRARKDVRSSLMELINSHIIYDPSAKGQQRYLDNFLFTVAAINPATANYDTDAMDMAEKSRFSRKDLESDKEATLNYLVGRYTHKINSTEDPDRKKRDQGRLELAKALLSSKEFEFDTAADVDKVEENGNGVLLSPRTLTLALNDCDGTKADLLRVWNDNANSLKKDMVKNILSNYKDIDDKANDALRTDREKLVGDGEKEIFASKLSKKIQDVLANL